MRKLLLIIPIFLFGCEETVQEKLSDLKLPVVVLSHGGNWFASYSITVKDSNGKIKTIKDDSFESFREGDTIK